MELIKKTFWSCRTLKRLVFFIFACILGFAYSGCGESVIEREFFAMDTCFEIKYTGSDSTFAEAYQAEVASLESAFSATDSQSALYILNETGYGTVSAQLGDILKQAITYQKDTNGYFSPGLGKLIRLWGFNTGNFHVATDDEISFLLNEGSNDIIVTPLANGNSEVYLNGAYLDLGGIAKGYAADRFRQMAETYRVNSAFASLGGMICAVGKKDNGELWKVGVSDPDGESMAAVLAVNDICISTSGSYQRYFEVDGVTYHHILNPFTGKPADNGLRSVTVLLSDGSRADAFSTALFVMGSELGPEFCEKNNIPALFITEDRVCIMTGNVESYIQTYSSELTFIDFGN